MIKAEVVKDSINTNGVRLTTLCLTYPRFIHSEFMTHRVFSRNAASSRAIPVKRMMKELRTNPAMPVYWGANQSGMQAAEELRGWRLWLAKKNWVFACYLMLFCAWVFQKINLHKQISNRILEPWFHMRTLVTATEWDNFLNLRRHKDAQPEMRELAIAIGLAMKHSKPKLVMQGEWHLPYIKDSEYKQFSSRELIMASVARCCRVSYLNHDGKQPDVYKDIHLHNKLLNDGHMSPLEHQAMASKDSDKTGNFTGGWEQYRKQILGERVFPG